MRHESDHNPDENDIAKWLRALDEDLPLPDPEFLRQLHEKTLQQFLNAGESVTSENSSTRTERDTGASEQNVAEELKPFETAAGQPDEPSRSLAFANPISAESALPSPTTEKRHEFIGDASPGAGEQMGQSGTTDSSLNANDSRSSKSQFHNSLATDPAPVARSWRQMMVAYAVRSSLAAAAALIMLASWLATAPPQNTLAAAVPFSDVLNTMRSANSLHLEVVKDGAAAEVWVRAPGLVRVDDGPHRYRIAAGSQLWQIDEQANKVSQSDSPWFLGPDQQVNLLGLMEIGIQDASSLLTAVPVAEAHYDGVACHVYRVTLPSTTGQIEVEALADSTTNQLRAIVAHAVGKSDANTPANPQTPPLAELKLIALNAPIADEKFQVSKSLTEDGRIGTVRSPQGVVTLRPLLAQRWTPVCRETALTPGDWLRTELRGANAVKVVLASETVLTLGPGSQVELISPTQARIHNGEIQVVQGAKPTPFELLAPRSPSSRKFANEGKTLVRVDRDERLVDVPQQPKWLAGFEGASNDESIGSLIVKLPDGRNEPLTVGYHKVSVEIRDQIARTTIEESFVNHTKSRLEGVFHFPLPQDASISGFGMWIGNELIEADVVEKQRAREIYETILRERRDPGLLEWTGGNIFKARVFPIEGRSEKRVKIVYTQVLPLQANRYRYSYGLRSELLRTNPLRELAISVKVHSALPLKNISCPTHPARRQLTQHSGQIDFAAQEYTPARDFEVLCDIDQNQSDVVAIPHRRGDDGYLLIQITPPEHESKLLRRDLVPDGRPLQLALVCDTSGSMDSEKRKQQAELVTTLLSALGEADQFSLIAVDVNPVWCFPKPVAATANNLAAAQKFLGDRISLGWTDLDRGFSEVLKKVSPETHVIYVGDGIVTAGNTDPSAFVNRLEILIKQSVTGLSSPTRGIHAVSVGNSFESIVLKGISALGGGSVRSIGGEQTPQTVATELLKEIAQPGLRDVKVDFRGLKVAAMYPDRLPNLPAGTQQILVGRYLPEGKDQQGEIIVTGKRGMETVRYVARVAFQDAESGNSFIPRLWARSHLDYLLQQGSNDAIRDDIIRLSEEFHIITPFTSLLVLETDADRERFGVQRRYEIRDGERFFAQGRASANFELLQQQMKVAGTWRQGLRSQILRSWARMGRDATPMQHQMQQLEQLRRHSESLPLSSVSPSSGVLNNWYLSSEIDKRLSGSFDDNYFGLGFNATTLPSGSTTERWGGFGGGIQEERGGSRSRFVTLGSKVSRDAPYSDDELFDLAPEMAAASPGDRSSGKSDFDQDGLSLGLDTDQDLDQVLDFSAGQSDDMDQSRLVAAAKSERVSDRKAKRGLQPSRFNIIGKPKQFFGSRRGEDFGGIQLNGFPEQPFAGRSFAHSPDYSAWLNTLFPHLEGATTPVVKPVVRPEKWSPEAMALSESLLRISALRKMENGGIEYQRTSEAFNPRWQRRESKNSDVLLYSPTAWVTRPSTPGINVIVEFCDLKSRGAFSQTFLLGKVRDSEKSELESLPLAFDDLSLTPLHESRPDTTARVEATGDQLVTLIVLSENDAYEQRFTIDTLKHVLVKQVNLTNKKVTGTTTWSEFVEVAGTWWAQKSITADERDRKVTEVSISVKALPGPAFQERFQQELSVLPRTHLIRLPAATLKVARQKTTDGSATVDDHLVMLLHNASLQLWDNLFRHLESIEKSVAEKPGLRWIRPLLQSTARRNDEARRWYLDEAKRLATNPHPDDLFLAEFVLGQAYGITAWSEYLELVELLRPIYERQRPELDAVRSWQQRLASCYDSLGRQEEAVAIRKSLAEQAPWNLDAQIEFARRLKQLGRFEDALVWLQREFDRKVERTTSEIESLNGTFAEFYRAAARWPDLLKFTAAWKDREPESRNALSEYLSALIFNNQLEQANQLVDTWLKERQINEKLKPADYNRLDVATNFALGQISHISVQRMQDRWTTPLAQMARFFLRHPHHFEFTVRIMGNYYFGQSDESDRLRGESLLILQRDGENLNSQQLRSLVNWSLSGRLEFPDPVGGHRQMDAGEVDLEIWKKIAATIQKRWASAQDIHEKHALSETLVVIYSNRFRKTEYLPHLRERIGSAASSYKHQYISSLFEAILTADWTSDVEAEAFLQLRNLSDEQISTDRLMVIIPALHRLVDQMLANRIAQLSRRLTDQGETAKLTRQELAKKNAELRTTAKKELAARLAVEATQEPDAMLAKWLRMEQAWIDVQTGERIPKILTECWKIVGDTPPKTDPKPDTAEQQAGVRPLAEVQRAFLDALLQERAFSTILHLTMRRDIPAARVDQLLKFIDQSLGSGGERVSQWRLLKFQVLVGLDRADDLEKELRQWIQTDDSTAPWRIMLGQLLAERGKIEEAVSLFEASEKHKLLTASDYHTLASWYLVLNRRDAYERSLVEAFKQAPEDLLNNMIYQVRNRWMQTDIPLPSELDENTLLAWKALFEKSSQPENYLSQLRDLYTASRDFRLLQMIPNAVLGRSPQQVYQFVAYVQSQVLYELRSEATADEMVAEIQKLRAGQRTQTDLRALDLLEAAIERKSSEVLNQPGPHVDACLRALQRSFQHKWAEGEAVQMAEFLKNFGTLHHPQLIEEQLRQIRELLKLVPEGRDHLVIADDYCHLMFWNYNKQEEALRTLEAELRTFEQAHAGRWPHQDHGILANALRMLESANRHATGEQLVQKYLTHSEHSEQQKWLVDQLNELYNSALQSDGTVSLGSGEELFKNLVQRQLAEIEKSSDEVTRHNVIARMVTTLDIARRKQFSSTAETVRRFAFDQLPSILKRQQSYYRNSAQALFQIIRDVLGPRESLRYVVERMEQFPSWMDMEWNSSWNSFGYELGHRHQDAVNSKVDVKDLEPRLLKLVLDELRRELRTGENRNRVLYHNHYSYFWTEKVDDFVRVANEIYAEQKTSGRRAMRVAQYLWSGLERHPRAIEILFQAHQAGQLGVSEISSLIIWLQIENRFGESVPLLEPLVKAYPENLVYRTQLMSAYHHLQRPEQLRDLVEQTDRFFHQEGRWSEDHISAFARACQACELNERAITYFKESIALHQRNNPGSGLGDLQLSGLYQELARAHSALGQTQLAVEAASAAIICWSARHEERVRTLATLKDVLQNAKDLDTYVKTIDQQTAMTGQDSPVLRKAIGQAYQQRSQWDQAITQLQLAMALQPNDKETHQALIACFDSADPAKYQGAAVKQLLDFLDLHRHDLGLTLQLVDRLKSNEAEAERAATSLIEVAPHESESHTALAELRQKQGRWSEAIPHWEQVAKLRRLEPTGLIQLTNAQLHEKQWEAARKSIKTLQETQWPARFGDVLGQTRQMQQQLPQ